MSFQWVIDNAESISIKSLKQVSTTVARDGGVKATSRGFLPRQIEVKLPDGITWDNNRGNIRAVEALDRTTSGTFQINNPGQSYIIGYQGSYTQQNGYGGAIALATITKDSTTLTITGSGTLSSGYKFKKGDFIQINSGGEIYQVNADVPHNSNTLTVDRPVVESSGTGKYIFVGKYCTFRVICTSFPSWTIFQRNQIAWSGPFVFVEV